MEGEAPRWLGPCLRNGFVAADKINILHDFSSISCLQGDTRNWSLGEPERTDRLAVFPSCTEPHPSNTYLVAMK